MPVVDGFWDDIDIFYKNKVNIRQISQDNSICF